MKCSSLAALLCISTLHSVTIEAQDRQNPSEFGIELGAIGNSKRPAAPRATTPVSVRFGGIGTTHRFGAEGRLTLFDERVQNSRTAVTTSAQVTYRILGFRKNSQDVSGLYFLAGGAVVHSSQIVQRGATVSRRFLYGVQAGVGSRVRLGAGFLRPEIFITVDQGLMASAQSSAIPFRRELGGRVGYSWVWF
jgi:hypothetical protein